MHDGTRIWPFRKRLKLGNGPFVARLTHQRHESIRQDRFQQVVGPDPVSAAESRHEPAIQSLSRTGGSGGKPASLLCPFHRTDAVWRAGPGASLGPDRHQGAHPAPDLRKRDGRNPPLCRASEKTAVAGLSGGAGGQGRAGGRAFATVSLMVRTKFSCSPAFAASARGESNEHREGRQR